MQLLYLCYLEFDLAQKSVLVRGLDDRTVQALDILAAKRGVSREALLRELLLEAVNMYTLPDPWERKLGMMRMRRLLGDIRVLPPENLI